MANKFNQIKDLRESFEFNLDDVSTSKFETTRSLFDNFTSAFNVKALAIAAMMGLSVGSFAADAVPLTAIQDTFNQSMQMTNSNYKESLPTYFENKQTIKSDITLKNEFWNGSVVTLVVGDAVSNEIEDAKYEKQIYLMNKAAGTALYVSEFISRDDTDENYYTAQNTYKHYFRNDHSNLVDFEDRFRQNNKRYFDDYITYHEMAHASFEQENSRLTTNIALHLTPNQFEAHADVASLLMVANKNAMKYEDFRDLVLNIAEVRSYYAAAVKDTSHNSSITLIELVHTLDENKNLYDKMSMEKISAFAAYFVHGVYNQDPQQLLYKLDNSAIPVKIEEFLEGMDKFRDALKDLDSKSRSIVTSDIDMGGAPFYTDIFEKIYFERNPKKFDEYNEAIANNNVMKAAGITVNAFKEIMNHDDTEKAVYAVAANKMMRHTTFDLYSNSLSNFYAPTAIIKIHDSAVLTDLFKANRNEMNKIISSDIKIKNNL